MMAVYWIYANWGRTEIRRGSCVTTLSEPILKKYLTERMLGHLVDPYWKERPCSSVEMPAAKWFGDLSSSRLSQHIIYAIRTPHQDSTLILAHLQWIENSTNERFC